MPVRDSNPPQFIKTANQPKCAFIPIGPSRFLKSSGKLIHIALI